MTVYEESGVQTPRSQSVLRLVVTLIISVVTVLALAWGFGFMRNEETPKALILPVALIVGVCGVWALYWILNDWVSMIPFRRLRENLIPFVFVGPALLLLTVYLIYPVINTVYISFLDRKSESFVGLDNYVEVFTNPDILIAFRNNILWLVVATGACVILGLLIAVLVDRIRRESLAKSSIFLPMAISAVGASVIWRFIYAYMPAGRPQIGLLNAIRVALGADPIGWYLTPPWNNFALMAILIWWQTGFCMVVLSAAIKGVPGELLDAARVDGANEFQIFSKVTVPYIRGTIITVTTMVLIMVLRVFDIVYVMTRGNYDTEVIANRMFLEMYRFGNYGRGSALAVILFLAVVPAIVVNVRNLRQQRSES